MVVDEKDTQMVNNVLELSVKIGSLGAHVNPQEIKLMESLLQEHCVSKQLGHLEC